jgi:acyl carrier protein
MKSMPQSQLLRSLEEVFEAETNTLHLQTRLEEIPQWGSLTFLGLLAFVDEQVGISLSPNDVAGCTTIGDVIKLLGDHIQPD